MICFVVDSTCDIPEAWREHYKPEVLPLIVSVDGREYLDQVDIQLEELHGYMRQGIVPKTAQVPAEQMYEIFGRHLKQGEDVIYLSFSAAMSGTYALAAVIMEELREKYPKRRLALVDSRGGCLATGLIAVRACALIEQGASFDTVVSETERMVGQVEHLFTLPNLNWLVKGGRVARPLGFIGDVINIKPVLDVENGKMVVIKMVRGNKKSLQYLADELALRAAKYPDQWIALAHCADPETAALLERLVKERLPHCHTVICKIGCVLSAHLGIGGVGAFFFREP